LLEKVWVKIGAQADVSRAIAKRKPKDRPLCDATKGPLVVPFSCSIRVRRSADLELTTPGNFRASCRLVDHSLMNVDCDLNDSCKFTAASWSFESALGGLEYYSLKGTKKRLFVASASGRFFRLRLQFALLTSVGAAYFYPRLFPKASTIVMVDPGKVARLLCEINAIYHRGKSASCVAARTDFVQYKLSQSSMNLTFLRAT